MCDQSGSEYWKREWPVLGTLLDDIDKQHKELARAEAVWEQRSGRFALTTDKLGTSFTVDEWKKYDSKTRTLRRNIERLRSDLALNTRHRMARCESHVCQQGNQRKDRVDKLSRLSDTEICDTMLTGYTNFKSNQPALLGALLRHSRVNSLKTTDNRYTIFEVDEVPLCWCCFCAFHGIRAGSLETVDMDGDHPEFTSQEVRTACARWPGEVNREIQEFIGEHYEFLADWDPEGGTTRIPSDVKFNVYNRWYIAYCENLGLEPAHYSYFCFVWRSCFDHVRMTDKTKFSQCGHCQGLNHELRTCPRDNHKLKQELFAAKCAHIEYVRNCRRVISYWRLMAMWYPANLLFMNADRMDASKTLIPKLRRGVKSFEYGGRVNSTVMASVTNFGDIYAISDKGISIKTASGRQYVEMQALQMASRFLGGRVPKRVIIVEDNSPENKNHLRRFFWGALVASGVIDEVHFYYMPVGHTHGPVDRRFGRISVLIGASELGVLSPKELSDIILKLSPEASGPHKARIRNVVYWLLEHPELREYWHSFSDLKKQVEALPCQDVARVIITREKARHARFQCFRHLFRPTELCSTYNWDDLERASDYGKCGSLFTHLLKESEPMSDNLALNRFTEWWRENVFNINMTLDVSQVVDFTVTMSEEARARPWCMGAVKHVNTDKIRERLETPQIKAKLNPHDRSWEEYFDAAREREQYACDRCKYFEEEDLRLKISVAAGKSQLGSAVIAERTNQRNANKATWAAHMQETNHGVRDTWSMKAFLDSLTSRNSVGPLTGFQWLRWGKPLSEVDEEKEVDEENAPPPLESLDSMFESVPEAPWDFVVTVEDPELRAEINKRNRMLTSSGFLNGRWRTLRKLGRGFPVSHVHNLTDAVSHMNSMRHWDVFNDCEVTDRERQRSSVQNFFEVLRRGPLNPESGGEWEVFCHESQDPRTMVHLIDSSGFINWWDDELLGKWFLLMETVQETPDDRVWRIARYLGKTEPDSLDGQVRLLMEFWEFADDAWEGDERVLVDTSEQRSGEWPPENMDRSTFRDNVRPSRNALVYEVHQDRYSRTFVDPWLHKDMVDVARERAETSRFLVPFHVRLGLRNKFVDDVRRRFFHEFEFARGQ